MKKLLLLFLLTAARISAQSVPVNIPIVNPSFEIPAPGFSINIPYQTPCGNTLAGFHPLGWDITRFPSGGGWAQIQWKCVPEPDGTTALMLEDATATQDLGNIYTPVSGIYELDFYVANWFYWYSGHYTAALFIGDLEVCSVSGYAVGDFTKVPLVCPWRDWPSSDFKIVFTGHRPDGSFWPVLFDKISLTFTPTN